MKKKKKKYRFGQGNNARVLHSNDHLGRLGRLPHGGNGLHTHCALSGLALRPCKESVTVVRRLNHRFSVMDKDDEKLGDAPGKVTRSHQVPMHHYVCPPVLNIHPHQNLVQPFWPQPQATAGEDGRLIARGSRR